MILRVQLAATHLARACSNLLALDANNVQVLGETLLIGTLSCSGLVMNTCTLVWRLAYVEIGSERIGARDSFCLGWQNLGRE